MVYWTEISSPSISKASIQGGEPTAVIRSGMSTSPLSYVVLYLFICLGIRRVTGIKQSKTVCCILLTDLGSPEGLAIDYLGRTMFWTDSVKDVIEVASLDGSQRRVIIDSDLVNPRAIITDPSNGCVMLYGKHLCFVSLFLELAS